MLGDGWLSKYDLGFQLSSHTVVNLGGAVVEAVTLSWSSCLQQQRLRQQPQFGQVFLHHASFASSTQLDPTPLVPPPTHSPPLSLCDQCENSWRLRQQSMVGRDNIRFQRLLCNDDDIMVMPRGLCLWMTKRTKRTGPRVVVMVMLSSCNGECCHF